MSNPLDTHGDAHPSSDAEGRHSFASSSPLQSVQQRYQHSAARHPDGMTQGNRPTAHVHLNTKRSRQRHTKKDILQAVISWGQWRVQQTKNLGSQSTNLLK